MTLGQLQSFVLVAQLGSVKAAAAALEVTEPAVSVAVAALRKELGDELFVREGRGIALTPGGRRLAALAGEILALAEQARRSVQESDALLKVAATSMVAEHISPLIDAFTARHSAVEIEIEEAGAGAVCELLEQRRADIALGPHPGPDKATIATVPFLRAILVVVAAPGHPLAEVSGVSPLALADSLWLVGPGDLEPATATGSFLAQLGIGREEVSAFSSHTAAIAAAAAGEGLLLTLAHSVLDEVRRRALIRLDVRGTPLVERWYASTPGLGRALPAALSLQRFATTLEATHAISGGRTGRVSSRARPAVHVTLWSSITQGGQDNPNNSKNLAQPQRSSTRDAAR